MAIKSLLTVAVALCVGCECQTDLPTAPPPQATAPGVHATMPPAGAASAANAPDRADRIPPLPAASVAPANVTTDQFGFPLVISIETPPVPEQIEGPSPPIQTDSKTRRRTTR